MKRYTVSQVRERLADALDEAERGTPVVIERKGVRYVLQREAQKPVHARRTSQIEIVDAAVADGQWEWTWGRRGLKFRPGRARR